MKRLIWIVFGLLAIAIGLYPLIYIILKRSFFIENNGFLASKSTDLLESLTWNISFFGHIIFGGIALLIGWIQFSEKLRLKNIKLHKTIGKVYMLSVVISAVCGLYIGFFANSGIISALGFISLGIFWLVTTLFAYKAIRNGNIQVHRNLMIYSYAACFAAVTLRIWFPILIILMGEFDYAYRTVAWLCWIPNIIVAYFIIKRKKLGTGKVAFYE